MKGLDAFPRGPLAGQHPAALLQLSHHGGAGNDLHRASWRWPPCSCGAARSIDSRALLWLLMLMLPFPYIANTAGLDHRGSRPPAVADLRPHAHARRRLAARLGRQRAVHADRLHGHVHGSRRFCSCSWSIAKSKRARARRPNAVRRLRLCHGNHLVLSGRRDARRLRGAGRLRSRRRHRPPVGGAHRRGAPRRCCAPSARSGTATKSGCWPAAARSTSPSPRSMPPASAASICR